MYAKDYKEYLKTHDCITINYAVVSHCNLQCIGCRVHAPIAPKWFVHNITALNTNFGTDFKLIEGEDYLVLDNIKNKEEIFNWLVKPMPFCKYCGSDETTGSYNHNEYVLWEPSMKKSK